MSSPESESTLIVDPATYEATALARLRQNKERAMETRRQVIRILAAAERPLSHGEIVRRQKAAGSAGDKNTASRALALFERIGIVVRTKEGYVPYLGEDANATLAVRNRDGRYQIRPIPEGIASELRATVDNDPSAVIRVEITLPNDGPGGTEENDDGED